MRPITSQMPPPRWQPTNFRLGKFSKTPRTIMREMAKHSSKGRPTLDASRYSLMRSSPKPTDGACIVVGIRSLVAGVDEHAFHAVFNDRPLQLFQKWLAAAGQGTGKDDDPALIL